MFFIALIWNDRRKEVRRASPKEKEKTINNNMEGVCCNCFCKITNVNQRSHQRKFPPSVLQKKNNNTHVKIRKSIANKTTLLFETKNNHINTQKKTTYLLSPATRSLHAHFFWLQINDDDDTILLVSLRPWTRKNLGRQQEFFS